MPNSFIITLNNFIDYWLHLSYAFSIWYSHFTCGTIYNAFISFIFQSLFNIFQCTFGLGLSVKKATTSTIKKYHLSGSTPIPTVSFYFQIIWYCPWNKCNDKCRWKRDGVYFNFSRYFNTIFFNLRNNQLNWS